MKRKAPADDREVKKLKKECGHPRSLLEKCPVCEVLELMQKRRQTLQELKKGVGLFSALAELCGEYVSFND
jgi:hypothetical protein